MAETKVHKVTVKNISGGPRILNSMTPTLHPAGMVTEGVEISDVELKAAEATGWFEFGGAEAGEPGPLDGSVEALNEHLATVEDVAEVEKLLEAETAGKSRKSALAALNERLEQLKNPA